MRKIIVPAIALLAFVGVSCQPKTTTQESYTPEKTESMELTKFEVIKLQKPDIHSGDALLSAMQNRQSTREFKSGNLSLKHLSEIMWAVNGISRPESGKRTVPSARALYPIDAYAVLSNGIYLYEPSTHELIPVTEGDHRAATGMQPFVATAPLNIVLVADYNRYADMPVERRVQFASLDAGHCMQNVYLYCASEGLNVVERGSVDSQAFLSLLGIDNEMHEVIIAQTVGY